MKKRGDGFLPSPRYGNYYLPAAHGFHDRDIDLGLYGVVHVVRVRREGDVGDHLHDLLVGVAGFPGRVERLVGRVPVALDDLLGKLQGRGELGVFGLKALYALPLFLADALLLRNCGVYRESVNTAVVVGHRNRYGFLRLAVERTALQRT